MGRIKLHILLLLIFTYSLTYSQSNKKLINSIINSNKLYLDYAERQSDFGILIKQISLNKLTKLTKHKNPIIRMYSKIELIKRNDNVVLDFFKDELNNYNNNILVFEGCLGEEKSTASVIYENVLEEKILNTKDETKRNVFSLNNDLIIDDPFVRKLDLIILNSNCNIDHFILNKVFNRKYDESFLSQIENLAFNKNVFHALYYLIESKGYEIQISDYYKNKFSFVSFEDRNEIMSLINHLSYLLDSEDEVLFNIGLERLKRKEWFNHENYFFLEDIIEEKKIKI